MSAAPNTHSIPSYAYNASAAALGGTIRRGNRTIVVPTIASVTLASAGGEGSNSFENYFRDDISFTRAQTRVSGYSTPVKGSLGGRRYFTYADVLLTNLQVFDRVKINFMQATVTSERVIETNDPLRELLPDRSRFSLRLFYHGVEVDGDEIVPEIDMDLCHAGSYSDFVRQLHGKKDALPEETQNLLNAIVGGGEDYLQARYEDEDRIGKTKRPDLPAVNAPLVSINARDKVNVHGNRVTAPKFGRARFGEVLVKPDRQRLNLVRLTLDSDWMKNPPGYKELEPSDPVVFTEERAARTGEPAERENFSLVPGPGDGGGGSLSSGDGASNGIPIWP